MSRLKNKRAIITGAAGGIGSTVTRQFVNEGAQVFMVDTDAAALDALVNEHGADKVGACVADVSQESDVKKYVDEAVAKFGGVDVFMNNAAIEGIVETLTEYDVETWDKVMAINVRGAWLGMKHIMPRMSENGGSIVITSSIAGLKGTPGLSAYSTSKHAVVGLMRTAALEGAPNKIRVNSVHPGPIHTRMIDSIEEMASRGNSESDRQTRLSKIPLARYGVTEEVANLMMFLASDESAYCSGGTYSVDGGQTAR